MGERLPADRTETDFADYKLPLAPGQAVVEANRCLFCSDAPCIKACPTAIDIPQFIRKISTGNDKGSARTIFEANILGMSCARVCPVEVLCVGACVYNNLHAPPIQIGKLQRYATDRAYAEGWRFFEAGADTGKSVALIGGGPASLAAAHRLRRYGHRCTIYEKRPAPGGLNTTGVAPYKMRAEQSITEAEWVLSIGGIDIKTGTEVGGAGGPTLESIEQEHDAVFVGIGLGADSKLGVPGESLGGVYGAVDWIEQMKLSRVKLGGVKRCVVVGGGNTAIDAVREAKGLGISDVVMLYRGDEEGMSGYAHEWAAAKTSGVRGEWRAAATGFEGNGKVERVVCTRLDGAKRPVAGTAFAIETELVLVAIGQSKLGEQLGKLAGVSVLSGRIVTDGDGRTGRKKWYAGGDCANGGTEVVYAAAEGKRAAEAIHADLMGSGKGKAHG